MKIPKQFVRSSIFVAIGIVVLYLLLPKMCQPIPFSISPLEMKRSNINFRTTVLERVANHFSGNQPRTLAAQQMALVIQDAVDEPHKAESIDLELVNAMSCVLGVLEKQGISPIEAASTLEKIRDISLVTQEQESRYIKFNAYLSGKVLDMPTPDITQCKFKIE